MILINQSLTKIGYQNFVLEYQPTQYATKYNASTESTMLKNLIIVTWERSIFIF